jgi:hypothetical protein
MVSLKSPKTAKYTYAERVPLNTPRQRRHSHSPSRCSWGFHAGKEKPKEALNSHRDFASSSEEERRVEEG